MAYRGEDLDLRTPQTSAQPETAPPDILMNQPRASRRDLPAQRSSPIWVDDVLLDCCNHAYEIALAHRSAEVRVEHLIYAMTRLDVAADILEERGVRAAALRRETANVIATEIPVGLHNGKTTPRRSEALEEVLRIAAANAYRRQMAATVDDVLSVLLDPNVELPSALRLRAHTQRSSQPSPIIDHPPQDTGRERIRTTAYYGDQPRGPNEFGNLGASTQSPFANGPQSYGQGARLDVVEQTVRNISTELANERKILTGALHDLQREVMAQREETARLSGLSPEKLQGFLADRLQGLEQGFVSARSSAMSDISLIQDKISMLERLLTNELAATRNALNELSKSGAGSIAGADLAHIADRLDVIEEAVLSRETYDRLQSLESTLANEHDRATATDNAFNASLQSITTRLEHQPGEISSLVTSQITSLVSDRLNALSQTLDNLSTSTGNAFARAEQALQQLSTTQSGMASALESYAGRTDQELAKINEMLEKLGPALSDELTAIHDGLGKLNTNQHRIAATLETQGRETGSAFSMLAGRMEGIERAAAKPLSMLEALSGTTSKMHRLMVEKYFRKNRLWYWLFGTDDWLSASWPSQTARIAEELDLLKRR